MATGNDEVKCKRSLKVRETKKWKKVKTILHGSTSQSSDTTTSTCVMRKCNGNDVKKERDYSSERESIPAADQNDDKAPPNKLTGSEKEHEGEVIQNCRVLASQTEMNCRASDQGGCVEPTSTSEQSKSSFYITQEDNDSLKNQAAKLKHEIKMMNCGSMPLCVWSYMMTISLYWFVFYTMLLQCLHFYC
ncbi:hypothetical protein ACS0TY_003680 [Phlomoides rotata]